MKLLILNLFVCGIQFLIVQMKEKDVLKKCKLMEKIIAVIVVIFMEFFLLEILNMFYHHFIQIVDVGQYIMIKDYVAI